MNPKILQDVPSGVRIWGWGVFEKIKTVQPVLVWSVSRKVHNRYVHALNDNSASPARDIPDLSQAANLDAELADLLLTPSVTPHAELAFFC